MIGLMRKKDCEWYKDRLLETIDERDKMIRTLEAEVKTQEDIWMDQAVKYNEALQLEFKNMEIKMRNTFCDGEVLNSLRKRLKNYNSLINDRKNFGGSQSVDELLWRRDELRVIIGIIESQNPKLVESFKNPLCSNISWKFMDKMEKLE